MPLGEFGVGARLDLTRTLLTLERGTSRRDPRRFVWRRTNVFDSTSGELTNPCFLTYFRALPPREVVSAWFALPTTNTGVRAFMLRRAQFERRVFLG